MGWFAGVILFVMYRLGSDEIGDMEKSAKERYSVFNFKNSTQRKLKIRKLIQFKMIAYIHN
jgi:hypothetical protein